MTDIDNTRPLITEPSQVEKPQNEENAKFVPFDPNFVITLNPGHTDSLFHELGILAEGEHFPDSKNPNYLKALKEFKLVPDPEKPGEFLGIELTGKKLNELFQPGTIRRVRESFSPKLKEKRHDDSEKFVSNLIYEFGSESIGLALFIFKKSLTMDNPTLSEKLRDNIPLFIREYPISKRNAEFLKTLISNMKANQNSQSLIDRAQVLLDSIQKNLDGVKQFINSPDAKAELFRKAGKTSQDYPDFPVAA